jgi:hypothetical protein
MGEFSFKQLFIYFVSEVEETTVKRIMGSDLIDNLRNLAKARCIF